MQRLFRMRSLHPRLYYKDQSTRSTYKYKNPHISVRVLNRDWILSLSYFFLRMWYKMNAPTKPSSPSLLNPPKILIRLSTTELSGQKGIVAPLNSTSNTTPRAMILIPISVSELAQEPIFFRNSIIISFVLVKQSITFSYYKTLGYPKNNYEKSIKKLPNIYGILNYRFYLIKYI